MDYKQFPSFQAELLTKEKVSFPDCTFGDLTLVTMVFEKGGQYIKAQNQALEWQAFWEEQLLVKKISYYEVPLMSSIYLPLKQSTDYYMRTGIPNRFHANVACVYGKKLKIAKELEIEHLTECQTYLLDEKGRILFHAVGGFSNTYEQRISELIQTEVVH